VHRVVALVLVLALCGPVQAQTTPPISTASAVLSVIRIALNLGSGKQDYTQVDVVGEGSTVEQARVEGFRLAVNTAIGSVVAVQTKSQNQRLVRDEIINYSSGFVDRFEILEQNYVGNRVRLRMRVWVAESKLAQRLLGRSYDSQDVPGAQIQTQIQTIIDEREQGDRLVTAVMQDFPHRAFDVEVKKINVELDAYRRSTVKIPVVVRWNRDFVNAINQALELTKNDPVKHAMVYQQAVQSVPVIQISAIDAGGQVISRMCQEFTMSPHNDVYLRPTQYMLQPVRDRVFFNVRYSLEGTLTMPADQNIGKINQINATIVAQSKC
jgi:hypothetical protein